MKINNREFNEYLVLLYRFALMMVLFSICRLAFYAFNSSMFPNVTFSGLMIIMLGGLKFDVSGLLYLNVIFILLSVFPHPWKFSVGYQTFLKYWFFITNGIGIALNAIDFVYYRFIFKRTTSSVFSIIKNEDNLGKLFVQFLFDFWYVPVFAGSLIFLMVKFYGLLKPKPFLFHKKLVYYPLALFVLVLCAGLSIVGIRGGYKHSTRPITLSNAGEYVKSPEEMAIVLNTPFCVIRTWRNESFKKMNFYSDESQLAGFYSPLKHYEVTGEMDKKNVVILILESFNRELVGSLNTHLDNGTYKGYTPFLDSLISQSLVLSNAYANGGKSIDAMPSVVASIPALVLPYVITEYASNNINSLASLLTAEGYQTSFFHGAPNGSMGFQSFANLAGFQKYFGEDEYNNPDDYDGMWGIWDEPFMQYWGHEMTKMKEPFFSTLFSLSSHHPFKVPEKYEGQFPKGTLPVHQCVGYTDHAIRQFFAYASKQTWFNNTIFVITADHSTVSHYSYYQNIKNSFAVPIFFYAPGNPIHKVDTAVAQQLDIMPTILAYLNYSKPFLTFGNNLLDPKGDRFAVAYVNGSYQYMNDSVLVHFDGDKFTGYYNLKTDSTVANNLVGKVSDAKLEAKVKAFVQQFNNRMIENRLVP